MATLVDWDSMGGEKGKGGSKKKIDYLKIDAGQAKTFRPLGKAVQFVKFFVNGKSVVVDPEFKDQAAALIAAEAGKEYPGKMRFAINVLDREDNKVKVFEGGPQIFKHFANWSRASANTNPGGKKAMDWLVSASGSGINREYTTTPIRESILTDEEVSRCSKEGGDELYKLGDIYKSTPVNEVIAKLFENNRSNNEPASSASSSTVDETAGW